MRFTGCLYRRACSSSQLVWSKCRRPPAPCCIHRVNRANSCNGSTMHDDSPVNIVVIIIIIIIIIISLNNVWRWTVRFVVSDPYQLFGPISARLSTSGKEGTHYKLPVISEYQWPFGPLYSSPFINFFWDHTDLPLTSSPDPFTLFLCHCPDTTQHSVDGLISLSSWNNFFRWRNR